MNNCKSLPQKNFIIGFVDSSSYEIPYLIIVTNPAEYNSLFGSYIPPMPVFNKFTRFFIVSAIDYWKNVLKKNQYDFSANNGFFDDIENFVWEPEFQKFVPYSFEYEIGNKIYKVESYMEIILHEKINMEQIMTGRTFQFPQKGVNCALYTSGEFHHLPILDFDTKISID